MIDFFVHSADPIYAKYALCIAALLALAGLVLLILGPVLKRDIAGVWRTYRGWLVMAPLVLGVLWLGRIPTVLGLGLLSLAAFKEYARATGLYKDWWYTVSVYVGITALVVVMIVAHPRTGASGWYGMFMAMPVYAIALLLTVPVLRNKTQGHLQRVSLAIVGFVYLGWMFGHLGFLTNSKSFYGYVLYLIFAVELNDVAAFTFGKLFGKHKLRSEVSPNKTIEGSLGALATALALPWLLRFSFPHFGWPELVLTGLIVGIGGQLGDLTISFIKRDIGVKDMGTLIPGHGGILDRVDSLIFVAPLFFHMVRWFHGI